MTLRADRPTQADREIEPPGLSAPVDLSRILTVGATYHGQPVKSVVIVWDNGRLESELPETEEESGGRLANRILEVLRASTEPLQRKSVAKILGYETTTGRFGTTFNQLLSAGKIYHQDRYYTDDVSKFPDES